DRVIAAAGSFPGRVVLEHDFPWHGRLQPQLQTVALLDQEIIDEQFAPIAEVDRRRLGLPFLFRRIALAKLEPVQEGPLQEEPRLPRRRGGSLSSLPAHCQGRMISFQGWAVVLRESR